MIQEKTNITLKNGQICTFFTPTEEYAPLVLEHLKQTCGESENILRYQDEIKMTAEQERKFLTNNRNDSKSIFLCGFINNHLVVSTGLSPIAPFDRCIHRGEFGISVRKDYWNLGIGTTAMPLIIDAAKKMNYEQIELEVVSDNMPAFSLYKKYGFEIYGVRKNTFRYRDGHYCSCYLMALYL